MTVGDLIAMLQTTGIDNPGNVVFRDQAGTLCTPQITNYGPVTHIDPAQTTDPSYLEIKMVTATS